MSVLPEVNYIPASEQKALKSAVGMQNAQKIFLTYN